MNDRVRVRVVIEFEETLPDDLEAYEGETTPAGKAAKEAEYLREGDYLVQALSILEHTMDVTVEVLPKIESTHGEGSKEDRRVVDAASPGSGEAETR